MLIKKTLNAACLVAIGLACSPALGAEPANTGQPGTSVVQEIDQEVWATLRAQITESLRTKEGQLSLDAAIREKVDFMSPAAQQTVIQLTKGALGQLSMELEVGEGVFLPLQRHGNCHTTVPLSEDRAFVTTRVWPDGKVYYRFSDAIVGLFEMPPDPPIAPNDANALESIPNVIAAMLAIEQTTPLKFIGYDATVHGPGFIMIESNGPVGGCSNMATVGFTGGENFYNVCNWSSLGTIVHELGHAIGFFHEQQRVDRDAFIEVKEENLAPSDGGFPGSDANVASQFEKMPFAGITIGPYNFMSVMHYGEYAFSILPGELRTICVLPPNEHLQSVIGTGSFFSNQDIVAINALYAADVWIWDPTSLCPTDIDGNGVISVTDILLFLALLGEENVFADLNSDGRWDVLDLQIFMNRWTPGFCRPDDPINPGGRPTVTRPG